MKEPLRIYIASPYTPKGDLHDAARIVNQNVDRVIEAANYIHDIGHYAFVPHLSHYLHIHHSCKVNRGHWYYDYDNTFLDLWANAFLYLAPSFGADQELNRALHKGLIIFEDIKTIPVNNGNNGGGKCIN